MPTVNNDSLTCEEIASAEEFISQEEVPAETAAKSFRFSLPLFPALLILAAALLFALSFVRFPAVMAAFAPEPPLRAGLFLTDETTNRCIANLWHISRLRQEGKPIPESLVCPASKVPYSVRADSVSCPNPQTHNLQLLRITSENPIPEVR
jgi:hypothetical protein